MQIDIATLLIVIFAILPGLLGDAIYRARIGVSWREKDWQSLLRMLGFSVAGLTLYVIFANIIDAPQPIYILPKTFTSHNATPQNLPLIFVPYVGHFTGTVVAVFVLAYFKRKLARKLSAYPNAWDDFIRSCVPKRVVIIALNSGEAYAGILHNVDVSVEQKDRDFVLCEPA